MKGEGGEGESVVRNTDEAIIYTLILLTYTVWSEMGKVEWKGERSRGREERGRGGECGEKDR